ncbi:MAG: hypothetical protein HY892_21525 [Deltaproteobacteria bacterium]|nr:hypothetical protein [Deltaproteobacteria bacterium]
MAEPWTNGQWDELEAMKKIIDQMDGLLTDLRGRGQGVPIIEKNVRALKSFVAVLQYGISDLVEVRKTGVLE